ncbi:hypothetical protein GW17_00048130 [Ensete ventricosum]|nr:hypothetical protein GW17_00048130 [Ensete ventricosum]RZS24690.1 hypothetical protein BHM03_00057790 [Ensete ventricosum]
MSFRIGSLSMSEKKQGRRKRKREKFAVVEPWDSAADEENLARRRLLRHGLLLIAFSSSETARKRGGLGNIVEASSLPRR